MPLFLSLFLSGLFLREITAPVSLSVKLERAKEKKASVGERERGVSLRFRVSNMIEGW